MRAPEKAVIALLDKAGSPDHSFVSGMLAGTLARDPGTRVVLLVSREHWLEKVKPFRHHGAVCVPALLPRRHLGRLLNYIATRMLVRRLTSWLSRRGTGRVALVVRNDPVLLFGASHEKAAAESLVFQSSFPHEVVAQGVKRWLALWCYRRSGRNIDSVLAVSPLGLARVRRLFPGAPLGCYIPLLSDRAKVRAVASLESRGPIKFIYAGSHDPMRQLDVVVEAIVDAKMPAEIATFTFLGGSQQAVESLRAQVPAIQAFEAAGAIRFLPSVSRGRVFDILDQHDVGISLIPPLRIYEEASPTKLAEYMSSGLAVLASDGIALQEEYVRAAGCGIITEFEAGAITKTIGIIVSDRARIEMWKRSSIEFANRNFSYGIYEKKMNELLWKNREP